MKGFLWALGIGSFILVSPRSHAEDPFSGSYLFIQNTTSVTKLPVVSDVVATTRAISVQRLSFDGKWLRGQGKVCDVTIESNSRLVRTVLPAEFMAALPPVITDARLTKKGGTTYFSQAEQTLVLGADLKDKASEPLPTDANDPRVSDDDKDGNPGITVKVSGLVSGEIYLAQRSKSTLVGHASTEGFHGRVIFSNEQSILGATARVLRRDPRAKPDPARSDFTLKKLDGPIDCDEAKRLARTIVED